MTESAIERAKDKAVRFLKVYRAREKAKAPKIHHSTGLEYFDIGKENAALRRASMDLTRALADLRQGRE